MKNKRSGDQTITEYVKISRDNFVRMTVVGVLISLAFGLYTIELLPWATKKDIRHIWDLKKRVAIIEAQLGIAEHERQ
jgi:hypothetical protein